jgi:hypothetical protein
MAFDLRERSVRMVCEYEAERDACAASEPIAAKLGCTVETLHTKAPWD